MITLIDKMAINSPIYTYGRTIDDVITGFLGGLSALDICSIDNGEFLEYDMLQYVIQVNSENYSVDPCNLVDPSDYDDIRAHPIIQFTIADVAQRIKDMTEKEKTLI